MTVASVTVRTVADRIRPGRGRLAVGVLLAWTAGAVVLGGRDTLAIGPADLTWLHLRLNDLNDAVASARGSNPFFLHVVDGIRSSVDVLVRSLQAMIAQPAAGRPVPLVGWLGVIALAGYAAGAFAGVRIGVLTVAGMTFIGLQGVWTAAMDTLALTLSAVALALLLGIPIGVAAGVNDRFERLLTPLLDVAQTMPAFVYLAPLTLFFLIGPASATIVTLVYAAPPVVRLTAYGIRAVPPESVEAATSLGATGWQRLRDVQLPMSRRTIVVGINQTMMAALSMATITALIDAPGLGRSVLKSLETEDVGAGANQGLAIVVLAVLLDRCTTAVALRAQRPRRRTPRQKRLRAAALVAGGAVALWLVHLSRTYLWAARFPDHVSVRGRPVDLDVGHDIARAAGGATDWVSLHAAGATGWFKDTSTSLVIDPLQALLAGSPWWLTALALLALAVLAAGLRAGLTTAVGLTLLVGTGLWSDAMTTLAATVVATAAVMVVGVGLGVWMGRSTAADRALRPLLDAGQTMPAFVYMVPFVALFAATRFTAVVAAVVFATPVAVKIIADGVRAVAPETVEAARSFGGNAWQIVTTVQLPMARSALVLALNQGLVYVLSMVVVGGLVGAGALGYDVVAGFSQGVLYGKGLAAGAAVVVLGIVLDRVTQAAARRHSAGRAPTPATAPTTTAAPDRIDTHPTRWSDQLGPHHPFPPRRTSDGVFEEAARP